MATNNIPISVSENQERVTLRVGGTGVTRSVATSTNSNSNPIEASSNQAESAVRVGNTSVVRSIESNNGSPYYVGARAYVEQTANGAIMTVIDKEGTTTATILNGTDGRDGVDGVDGTDGVDGVDGVGITSITQNLDGTLTILLDDGSSYITEPLKGEDGADGQDGEDGVGIATVVLNADYTLTITLTDGTSVTTTSIRGAKGDTGDKGDKGDKGDTGATGNGIASVTKTGTVGLVDTYTITFTDGTTTTFTVTNGRDGAGSITDVTVNGVSVLDGSVAKVIVPTDLSDLNNDMDVSDFPNDAGYLTSYTETDPTVPSWAKASTKPTYTASEVGAQETLVSGTNIKTINSQSLLGSGDIIIESSGGEHIELTQTEYDALPQSEKDDPDKVYFVTDGTPTPPLVNDSVPIGAIQPYGGQSAPFGWLICDGSAVRRDTYSELFSAIGTTYGAGDGSSTFNVPDLRGKVLIGESTTHAIGTSGGEETHTLTVNETPQLPVASMYYWLNNYGSGSQWAYVVANGATPSKWSGSDRAHTIGAGGSHNNMQPYLVGNYIIKAKEQTQVSSGITPISDLFDAFYPIGSYYETSDISFNPNASWGGTWVLEEGGLVHIGAGSNYTIGDTGGEATHTLSAVEMPAHGHNVKTWVSAGTLGAAKGYTNYGTTLYNVTGGNQLANGTWRSSSFNAAQGGNGDQTGITDMQGGGQAHNNMQPYKVVNRWHRTA